MAFDEQLAQRVRNFLTAHQTVTERKTMGALCFMLNGNMCGFSRQGLTPGPPGSLK